MVAVEEVKPAIVDVVCLILLYRLSTFNSARLTGAGGGLGSAVTPFCTLRRSCGAS